MKIRSQLEGIRKGAREMFLNQSALLFRERVEREHRLKSQYKTREFFELLQNIDDAFDPTSGKPCVAEFRISNGWLEVSNNGVPFTIDTIKRLCQGSVSSKHGEYIGCKGIGFRSVLNWADVIEIFSGGESDGISVRFSENYAALQLRDIQSDSHIKNQMHELVARGIEPQYPVLQAPEYITPVRKCYDTVIRLHVKNEKILKQIRDDVELFDRSVILFMPHISEIIFIDEDKNKVIKKSQVGEVVTITENAASEQFVYRACDAALEQEYKGARMMSLAVAIPLDTVRQEYSLYSFFPIKDQKSPFNALLHGTFCLTDNRNELDISSETECGINKVVFNKLLMLYVSMVCDVKFGGDRVRLLKPVHFSANNFSFEGNLAKLECEETYRDYCGLASVFYTVNHEYIGRDDKPVFLSDCPEHFASKEFNRVVLYGAESDGIEFMQWVCRYSDINTEQYLYDAINTVSFRWSVPERCEAFKWWNGNKHFSSLPKLIKNIDGEFIVSKDDACFLSGSISNLPGWAEITIISEADERQLLFVFKKEISAARDINKKDDERRILPRLIRKDFINLQEQSSRQVLISPVNNSVANDFDRATDFVVWLMDIWKLSKFGESIVREISFNLPTLNGDVVKADNLYFGEDYGNHIGKEIFSKLPQYAAVATPSQLGINDNEVLKEMFVSIGVSMYPRTEQIRVDNFTEDTGGRAQRVIPYINRLLKKHPIKEYQVSYFNVSLNTIGNLGVLLTKLDTETVLKWLLCNSRLVEHKYEPEESFIEYKPRIRGQKYPFTYNLPEGHLPSYIRFIISSTSWVELSGKKYSPSEIIISNDNFLFEIGWPLLTETRLAEMATAIGCTMGRLKELLIFAGAKESILNLSSDDFYSILLRTSTYEDEISYAFSRRLYREIIMNGRKEDKITDFYSESDNQRRFFKEGKVLAKRGRGKSSYRPVENVFFSNSAVLNISDDYLIDIPPRSGQKDDFKDIFNIRPFSQKYRVIDWTTAISNHEFGTDFRSFLPYLMTFRLNDIQNVSGLTITLISHVKVESENQTYEKFERYTVFEKSRNHWMILVDEDVSYAEIDRMQISACLDEIFNVFFNFPSKDFISKIGQFFLSDKKMRDYFILSEFGSKDDYKMSCRKLHVNSDICDNIFAGIRRVRPEFDDVRKIECINWFDTTSYDTQLKIVDLMKSTGLKLAELSLIVDIPLSLYEYNDRNIDESYNKYLRIFKRILYGYLIENVDKRQCFIEYYKSFTKPDLEKDKLGDIVVDADELLRNEMDVNLKRLKIVADIKQDRLIDYGSVYEKNLSKLQNCSDDYLNDFLNDIQNESLMYFCDYDAILNRFNQFIDELLVNDKDKSDNTPDDLSLFLNNVRVDGLVPGGRLSHEVTRRGTTVSGVVKQPAHNRRQGDIAEYLVVVKLITEDIDEVVEFLGHGYTINWKSGAAKRVRMNEQYDARCIRSDSDDALGYDIEVVSKDGIKRLYLEVKSSSSAECSFIMSQNEYLKAQHKYDRNERYRVVFVSNLSINNPETDIKISYLDCDIDDDRFSTKVKERYMAFKG